MKKKDKIDFVSLAKIESPVTPTHSGVIGEFVIPKHNVRIFESIHTISPKTTVINPKL